jgi:hypothetical protein
VNVPDLNSFRFQTFQGRYFSFFLPTFGNPSKLDGRNRLLVESLERERRMKFLNAGVVGLVAMDEAKHRQGQANRSAIRKNLGRPLAPQKRAGTGARSTLVNYEALTRKVIQALRHLGPRFASSR